MQQRRSSGLSADGGSVRCENILSRCLHGSAQQKKVNDYIMLMLPNISSFLCFDTSCHVDPFRHLKTYLIQAELLEVSYILHFSPVSSELFSTSTICNLRPYPSTFKIVTSVR